MNYSAIQERFFSRLISCSNPSSVTISFIKVSHRNSFESFLGDGQREEVKTFKLRCFYQRYTNNKQREKAGVTEDVTYSLFISPLELQQKTGSSDFPEYVRKSYSRIKLDFQGSTRSIESIVDLEPSDLKGELTRIAYKINLKGDIQID